MRQHGDLRCTRDALGVREPPPNRRGCTQYSRQRRRRTHDDDSLGSATARQRGAASVVAGDAVEGTGVIRELVVQLPAHDLYPGRNVSAWDAIVEEEQPLGVGVRQW